VSGQRRHRIRTVKEMGDAIVSEWPKIDPNKLEKLARSLPKWMDLCILAKGGPIKY
jgi:hypothetical protein